MALGDPTSTFQSKKKQPVYGGEWSGVRLSDGRRPYTASCGIWTK